MTDTRTDVFFERYFDLLLSSTRGAVADLLRDHADHHFYYVTLVTTAEGHAPTFSAWSHEALADAPDPVVKWSYADSPFHLYSEERFAQVRALVNARGFAESDEELDGRLRVMEAVMRALRESGAFARLDPAPPPALAGAALRCAARDADHYCSNLKSASMGGLFINA